MIKDTIVFKIYKFNKILFSGRYVLILLKLCTQIEVPKRSPYIYKQKLVVDTFHVPHTILFR